MNERIKLMKSNINKLNDDGLRKTTFYNLVKESLDLTIGEPIQIRRAKAIAYLLDKVELQIFPHEMIVGSVLGMFPLQTKPIPNDEQLEIADLAIERYLRNKKTAEIRTKSDEEEIKTFEAEFGSQESRWALMSRVHHDASISYQDLQNVIKKMEDKFSGVKDLEKYEIGRELERSFKIEYENNAKEKVDELPWFAANHLSYNYKKVIDRGLGNIKDEINEKLIIEKSQDKLEFYKSTKIVIESMIRFIKRYADVVEEESKRLTSDKERSEELKMISLRLKKIAEKNSSNFIEAIQTTWILHVMASICWGSALSFGRFDQYMFDLYDKDIKSGAMTRDEAKDILSCFWLKINEPKMRTVQSLTLGGITPEGIDAVNDLTKLCLEVTQEMKLPYPNIGLRINKVNPDWIYNEAVNTIVTGSGHPMILNDEIWISSLKKLGYGLEDANNYYNMGCVEIMIPNKQPNWGVTEPIAFPILIDKVFKKWENKGASLDTFNEFIEVYLKELKKIITEKKEEAINKSQKMLGRCYDPFASILIDDCIEQGKDLFHGGSACPTHWSVYAFGLGTLVDSLSAVKQYVYDEKKITISEMYNALKNDFKGYEELKQVLNSCTIAFGNNYDQPDQIAETIMEYYTNQVLELNGEDFSGKFVSTLFSYFSHVYAGEITGATPNGRGKGVSFSDGIGPSQGKDTEGPTNLLGSILKIDHSKVTGGYALNLKINPSLLKNKKGLQILEALIKTYLTEGGPQIQVNYIDINEMKEAQINPDLHKNLIVRVGGYSEYFINLDKELQNEIITRTEYDI